MSAIGASTVCHCTAAVHAHCCLSSHCLHIGHKAAQSKKKGDRYVMGDIEALITIMYYKSSKLVLAIAAGT